MSPSTSSAFSPKTPTWRHLDDPPGQTRNHAPGRGAKSDHRIYVPFVRGAEVIHELGGIVSVHAGKRSNSIEAVRNNSDYKMAFKQDLAHDHVDIFEIGDIADLAPYRSLVFRSIGARLPLVMGSDNHDIKSYTRKVPCWVKADCTFSGLCHVLHEPDDRVHLGDLPASVKRVQGSKTKYIQSVAVRKVADSPLAENWFGGEVPLNSGFVAIIGNKGGGKSALADIIALLADSQKGDHFSFLCGEKFRQPRANKATHFEAEITWVSGGTARRLLSDDVDGSSVEAVKYVPQSYLERVCNELGGGQQDGFARELRAVIFSHVEEAERLGHATLDALLEYRTEETTQAIELLTGQLRDAVKRAIDLEDRNTPAHRRQVENHLEAKRAELAAHQSNRPPAVPRPQSDPAPQQRAEADALAAAEAEVASLDVEIGKLNGERAGLAKRAAAADKLLARIKNLRSQVAAFERDSEADCQLLEIDLASLLTFDVNTAAVEVVKAEAARRSDEIQAALGSPKAPGLLSRREQKEEEAKSIRDKLDEPARKYQEYLVAEREWQEAEAAIVGADDAAGTLKFYEKEQKALDTLPQEIAAAWEDCFTHSVAIHKEILKLADAHRAAFRPVQEFVEQHPLAKGRFDLRFDASIVCSGFDQLFLEHINQGRRGTFCGADEGRDRVRQAVSKATFDAEQGVRTFLEEMRSLLNCDHRQKTPGTRSPGRPTGEELVPRHADDVPVRAELPEAAVLAPVGGQGDRATFARRAGHAAAGLLPPDRPLGRAAGDRPAGRKPRQPHGRRFPRAEHQGGKVSAADHHRHPQPEPRRRVRCGPGDPRLAGQARRQPGAVCHRGD